MNKEEFIKLTSRSVADSRQLDEFYKGWEPWELASFIVLTIEYLVGNEYYSFNTFIRTLKRIHRQRPAVKIIAKKRK